jgi:hypothetical protein
MKIRASRLQNKHGTEKPTAGQISNLETPTTNATREVGNRSLSRSRGAEQRIGSGAAPRTDLLDAA